MSFRKVSAEVAVEKAETLKTLRVYRTHPEKAVPLSPGTFLLRMSGRPDMFIEDDAAGTITGIIADMEGRAEVKKDAKTASLPR